MCTQLNDTIRPLHATLPDEVTTTFLKLIIFRPVECT